MNKTPLLAICVVLVLALPSFAAQTSSPPRYREWLEDVSPIITRTEREIFTRLKTDTDREKFIKFFWRQRDTFPDTAENEFDKEYMERVRFADQNFGRDTSKRGSQTERGYFYLLLGTPLERQLFTTQSQVWPLELWFYKGTVELRPAALLLSDLLPAAREAENTASTLPGIDGPEKLVVPTMASRVAHPRRGLPDHQGGLLRAGRGVAELSPG